MRVLLYSNLVHVCKAFGLHIDDHDNIVHFEGGIVGIAMSMQFSHLGIKYLLVL